MNKLWRWIADRLPRQLVYFCGIRIAAHGTTGKYSNQVVPELTLMDAIKRWDAQPKRKGWALRTVVLVLGLAMISGCANYRKPTAADVMGTILIAPPALAMHAFWTVYGAIIGVPLSYLEPDATEVPLWWTANVGPTYVSTKFLNPFAEKDHWAYYGNEPEAWFYLEGDKVRRKIFSRMWIDELDIDRHTWAPLQDAKRTLNIRGDETKPFRIKGE